MFSTKACVTCQKNTRFKALMVMAVVLICTMLTGAVNDTRKEVTLKIYDDFSGVDMVRNAVTSEETVEEFLSELQIVLEENDRISMTPESALKDGDEVIIRKGKGFSLAVDGSTIFIQTTHRTLGKALSETEISLGESDMISHSFDTPVENDMAVTITRVSQATEKETEIIPFTKETVNDKNLYKDEKVIRTKGVDGSKELTYVVTYHNGEPASRELVSEVVTAEPVTEVTAVGTKTREVKQEKSKQEKSKKEKSDKESSKKEESKKEESKKEDTKKEDSKKESSNNENSKKKDFKFSKMITMTATAYDPYPAGGSGTGITASGMKAEYGVVAVDPKVIPLGTKLYIESTDDGASWTYGYCIAGDTGGAIKGNKIDLCYNTVSECIQFGRKSANVYILE